MDAEQVPWGKVICLANAHLLTPTLAMALADQGLRNCLSADVGAYLQRLYTLNLQRNQHLRAQLIEVGAALNRIGVEPVLLKGACSLVTRMYSHPGSRMMTDLDVLVPQARIEACREQLQIIGYGMDDDDGDFPADHHHIAPLRRPGEYAVVELHQLLVKDLRTGLLFGTRVRAEEATLITERLIAEADHVQVNGVSLRVPKAGFRVLHSVLHSAFLDREHREGALPLRNLHELALLLAIFRDELDWALIRTLLGDSRKVTILSDWLYLANRLYGAPLPQCFRRRQHAHIHFLRCRLQARWGVAGSFRALARLSPGHLRDPRMQCD